MRTQRSAPAAEGNSASSAVDALGLLSLEDESAAGAAPAWRSATQLVIASVVCVVAALLLVVFTSQWMKSAVLDTRGRPPCHGAQCVELSLEQLESETGVTFPPGTTVAYSSLSSNRTYERVISFEVVLPTGAPLPEVGKPWQSEPHPETGRPSFVDLLMEQGLKDPQWTNDTWVAGVDENGDTIVLGGKSEDFGSWWDPV